MIEFTLNKSYIFYISVNDKMFVTSKKAQEYYKVAGETLRSWALRGEIEFKTTAGGHRRYKIMCPEDRENNRKSYIYARVSSKKQDADLQQQIKYLSEKYPEHEVVSDIGSGINPNRKGFKALLDKILSSTVREIVVAHRDRLSRFSFEFISQICKKFGTKIKVLGDEPDSKTPSEELAEDLMSIITVFTARYYGSRKYNLLKEDKDLSKQRAKEVI
jgi:putative resolvase